MYTINSEKIFPFYEWIEENKEIIVIKINGEVRVFDSIFPHFSGKLIFTENV